MVKLSICLLSSLPISQLEELVQPMLYPIVRPLCSFLPHMFEKQLFHRYRQQNRQFPECLQSIQKFHCLPLNHLLLPLTIDSSGGLQKLPINQFLCVYNVSPVARWQQPKRQTTDSYHRSQYQFVSIINQISFWHHRVNCNQIVTQAVECSVVQKMLGT